MIVLIWSFVLAGIYSQEIVNGVFGILAALGLAAVVVRVKRMGDLRGLMIFI